jgi:hypothetical protein
LAQGGGPGLAGWSGGGGWLTLWNLCLPFAVTGQLVVVILLLSGMSAGAVVSFWASAIA